MPVFGNDKSGGEDARDLREDRVARSAEDGQWVRALKPCVEASNYL
jgi:hypothetical protein